MGEGRSDGSAIRLANMMRAALGIRTHSGWAALVAVAGPTRSPTVIDRRRIEIADPSIPGSAQPYHAAAELDLKKAEQFIVRSGDATRAYSERALLAVVDPLQRKGHQMVGCGVILGSGRAVKDLTSALSSHAFTHAAEGEFFRNAIMDACKRCSLPVVGVPERELFARGALELGLPVDELRGRVTELGRSLGPPWRQDEKQAALVAWLAIATKA